MSGKVHSKIATNKRDYCLGNSEEDTLATGSEESLFSAFAVAVDTYEFPTAERVPAGYYISEIEKVDVRVKKGVKILDVGYYIWNNDQEFYIRQSYPEKTSHLKKFFEAMVAAGVELGSDPRDTVGIQEKIDLEYWSDRSEIGSIVRRMPYRPKREADEAEEG